MIFNLYNDLLKLKIVYLIQNISKMSQDRNSAQLLFSSSIDDVNVSIPLSQSYSSLESSQGKYSQCQFQPSQNQDDDSPFQFIKLFKNEHGGATSATSNGNPKRDPYPGSVQNRLSSDYTGNPSEANHRSQKPKVISKSLRSNDKISQKKNVETRHQINKSNHTIQKKRPKISFLKTIYRMFIKRIKFLLKVNNIYLIKEHLRLFANQVQENKKQFYDKIIQRYKKKMKKVIKSSTRKDRSNGSRYNYRKLIQTLMINDDQKQMGFINMSIMQQMLRDPAERRKLINCGSIKGQNYMQYLRKIKVYALRCRSRLLIKKQKD